MIKPSRVEDEETYVTIPKEIVEQLGLKEGEHLVVSVEDDKIILTKNIS